MVYLMAKFVVFCFADSQNNYGICTILLIIKYAHVNVLKILKKILNHPFYLSFVVSFVEIPCGSEIKL